MIAKVMITLSILGLFLTQPSYGMEQTQRNELRIIRQYQYNLKRIPENLAPEQKYIIQQHLKNQMNYERYKIRAVAAQKMAPPKKEAKAP
jgi:hypothetical protein